MSGGAKAVAAPSALEKQTAQVKVMSTGAKALVTPTTPETLAVDSPFSASRSAADLQGTLAVSYPLQPDQTSLFANSSIAGLGTGDWVLGTGNQEDSSPAPAIPRTGGFGAGNKQDSSPAPATPRVEQTIPVPTPEPTASPEQQTLPSSPSTSTPAATPTPGTGTPVVRERIIEVTSDSQVYDERLRTVTAEGNVIVRFDGGLLDADRVQVNLDNLFAVGEGNVALTRGDQILRGNKFTYNFVQDTGDMLGGNGEIFLPSAGTDLSFDLPTDVSAGGVPKEPISDRIRINQPLTGVSSPGGVGITAGSTRSIPFFPLQPQGGVVRRIRFQAERIDFYPRGWQARNVRITNDPFSPPELELRADKVTLTRETPLRDRIRTQRQRLVFHQRTTVPIPRDEQVIDRSGREVTPGLFSVGYDGNQRGGVFIERTFKPVDTDRVSFSITPQFLVQEAIQEKGFNIFDPAVFGLRSRLDANLGPKTTLTGSAILTSLDLGDIENNLRSSLRLRQVIGETLPHTLNLEYSYRDRLFNGTLGFQTVQSSLGGVITSPVIPLGKTGAVLSYQGGIQYINADTDRLDLLPTVRENNRVSLTRVQASAAVSRGFLLWQGKPLPATATEGLRYTPNPVVPYVQAFAGLTGTTSHYSSGDSQNTLTGTVGLVGQFGHFSRKFLDYTAFNIIYSQSFNSGLSPFFFDRVVDNRVLSAGIMQQIFGPFRLGLQTAVNLDTGVSSSTDYILDYNRRTYGITLRYNPTLDLASVSFRISDFNWTGGTNPFSEVNPVTGGVRRLNE
jgi:hypothetical protein